MKKEETIQDRASLEVSVQGGITGAKLYIEYPDYYEEDYQMPMLRKNRIPHILRTELDGIGNISRFSYEIGGMVSLRAKYERKKMGKKELQEFLRQFLEMTEMVKQHMLQPDCLRLEPEYIFFENGQYQFCYLPVVPVPMKVQFHRLTEFFVRQIDYEDAECIFLAHRLNRETMSEQYDVGTILRQYEQDAEKRKAAPEKGRESRHHIFEIDEDGEEETDERFGWRREETKQEEADICGQGDVPGAAGLVKSWIKKKRWGKWQDLILESDLKNAADSESRNRYRH